jgi:hypothetical protein
MTKVAASLAQSSPIGPADFLAAAPVCQPRTVKPVSPQRPTGDTATMRHTKASSFDPTAAVGSLFGPDRADRNEPTGPVVASGFAQRAITVFARIDADKDGFLTGSELNKALHSDSFKGEDAAVVAAMIDRVSDLEDLSDDEFGIENDGVTKADLAAFEKLDKSGSTLRKGAENRYGSAIYQQNHTTRQLFPRGAASISAAAVEQGGVGDCYFLAALAGLADRNPGAIQRMIKDHGNGTYTVSFPGRSPVHVDAPTDGEIGLGATANSDGLWVTVMEKAYAKLRSSTMDYEAIDGGQMSEGIEVLTGKSASTWNISLNSNESVRNEIATALKEGRTVTANIRPELFSNAGTREGMPTKHVYTIMGIDPKTNEIIVRNPWGSGGPKGDGIHRFTTDAFCGLFRSVCFQGR